MMMMIMMTMMMIILILILIIIIIIIGSTALGGLWLPLLNTYFAEISCQHAVAYRGVWGVQTPPQILKISVESSIT